VAVTGVPAREGFWRDTGPVTAGPPHAVLVAPGERSSVRAGLVRELESAGVRVTDASLGDPATRVRMGDIVVCAGGGETLWSAPAAGIPLVLLGEPPEAERASVDLLIGAGAALAARDVYHLGSVVAYLTRHPERLAALRDASTSIGRPAAARAVVERVFALIG
jgi:hypothetical protein